MRARLWLLAVLAVLASLGAACANAPAPNPRPPPAPVDATLEIATKSLAIFFGYAWGEGTLVYQGKSYPVTTSGYTVVAFGYSSATAKGQVSSLARLDDFDGNYVPLPGGSTLGEGGAGIAMKNPKGVEVRLISKNTGIILTLFGGGSNLSVAKEETPAP